MTMLKHELQQLGIDAYDEHTHQGMLRHLIVRKARATGEVMVVLVTRQKKFPQKDAVVELIQQVVTECDINYAKCESAKKRTSFLVMKRLYYTENSHCGYNW